jgi:predicted phosphodiesterase
MDKPAMHLVLCDIHFPEHSEHALRAVWDFMEKNRKHIASVTLNGDFLDCQNLSHHTKGKPRLRKHGGYKADMDGFKADVLDRIEELVKPGTKLTAIAGNHEAWIEEDLLDEMPELDGIVNIPVLLDLAKRGWKWIPQGGHIEIGRVIVLHGDQVGSGMHVSKKAVDNINQSCVMGHVHRSSSFAKAALVSEKRKWIGHTLGCLCTQAPHYARGAPNAFTWGFGIIETYGDKGYSNIHNIVIMPDGTFCFSGKVYGK